MHVGVTVGFIGGYRGEGCWGPSGIGGSDGVMFSRREGMVIQCTWYLSGIEYWVEVVVWIIGARGAGRLVKVVWNWSIGLCANLWTKAMDGGQWHQQSGGLHLWGVDPSH